MKKPTVYLETSFINRLADPLHRQPKTRHETNIQPHMVENRASQIYPLHLRLDPPGIVPRLCLDYKNQRIVRLRLRFFSGLTMVQCPPPNRIELADALRKPYGPIPADQVADSLHIATAAISGSRYLLTWNQKHIANLHTFRMIDTIIEEHGYQAPTIATPDQFLDSIE